MLAFRSLRSFRGEGSAAAWVSRIATRESWRRAHTARHRSRSTSSTWQSSTHRPRTAGFGPGDRRRGARTREAGRRAALRPVPRDVTLRFFGELSILEIAAASVDRKARSRPSSSRAQAPSGRARRGRGVTGSMLPRREPHGSSPHPTPPRAGRTGRGPRHRVPAPPEDDLAILALQRYMSMPRTCGLPTVSRCRSGCASLQSQPRVHRAACAAPSGCSACAPTSALSLDTSVRIGAAPDVRPGALQGARYGPGDRPGGRCVRPRPRGRASWPPPSRERVPSTTIDPASIRGPVTPSSEPSRWPSAIPVYPFGVGPASAPDAVPLRPRNRSRPTNPTMSSMYPPPEAPGRSERGEDRRGGTATDVAEASGVGV